jgi:hypothetical protein
MARQFQYDLFYLSDRRARRPGRKVFFELFDSLFSTLGKHLHPAIAEVSHVTLYLMPGRRTLNEVAISDTLDQPADQEFSSDLHYPNAFRHSISGR